MKNIEYNYMNNMLKINNEGKEKTEELQSQTSIKLQKNRMDLYYNILDEKNASDSIKQSLIEAMKVTESNQGNINDSKGQFNSQFFNPMQMQFGFPGQFNPMAMQGYMNMMNMMNMNFPQNMYNCQNHKKKGKKRKPVETDFSDENSSDEENSYSN